MDNLQKARDLPNFQNVLGHLMRGTHFIPICMCFSLPDGSPRSQIISTLNQGLEQLVLGFPWLSGQVTTAPETGLLTVVPGVGNCSVVVKDHTQDSSVPDMDTLAKARYPCSTLGREVFMPVKNISYPSENMASDATNHPVAVLSVQVNFIKGGLLLNLVGEHSVMDGVGFGRVIHMLSRACHGESFTDEELLYGNCDRTNLIPLLDQASFTPGPDMDHYMIGPEGLYPGYVPPKCTWSYFHFSPTSLSKLKALASASSSFSETPAVPYTTTNDAVTALMWKCTARARASNSPDGAQCMLVRSVDVRLSLSIPPTYLGNTFHQTYTKLPFASAGLTSLSTLASTLRSALEPEKLAHAIRSLATLITISEDKSKISYGADLNPKTDIWFSSWAKLDCYSLDFNLNLGFPEAIREPGDREAECLMYLMPMNRQGGIDAAICLNKKDTDMLKSDEEWTKFAEWIG